jgi:hypothetical protein
MFPLHLIPKNDSIKQLKHKDKPTIFTGQRYYSYYKAPGITMANENQPPKPQYNETGNGKT